MQWITAPRDDLLIYRGQTEITAEAIRDSFFPIPHIFDIEGRLPSDGDTLELRQRLLQTTGDYTLPPIIEGHRIWTAHNHAGGEEAAR